MFRNVVLSAAIVLLGAVPAFAQQTLVNSPTVSTEGRASMKVAPDVAWITVAAESRALKTADAQQQNATAMDSLRASLKRAGVPDDVVKTRSYSVEPQMQYTAGKSTLIGYIARQSLEVRVDDLARLGTLIDVAGSSGATSVSDVRYDVKARASIETRLLADAVRDGMKRAAAMASGAGKEVVSIWQISDQRVENTPQPMYRMAPQAMPAPAAPATVISPDEIEIQAHVTIMVILK